VRLTVVFLYKADDGHRDSANLNWPCITDDVPQLGAAPEDENSIVPIPVGFKSIEHITINTKNDYCKRRSDDYQIMARMRTKEQQKSISTS